MGDLVPTERNMLDGKIVDVAGRSWISNVEITLAARTLDGELVSEITHTDESGAFSLLLPDGRFEAARVTANLIGFSPIDLELKDSCLEAGEITLFANESSTSRLRQRDDDR